MWTHRWSLYRRLAISDILPRFEKGACGIITESYFKRSPNITYSRWLSTKKISAKLPISCSYKNDGSNETNNFSELSLYRSRRVREETFISKYSILYGDSKFYNNFNIVRYAHSRSVRKKRSEKSKDFKGRFGECDPFSINEDCDDFGKFKTAEDVKIESNDNNKKINEKKIHADKVKTSSALETQGLSSEEYVVQNDSLPDLTQNETERITNIFPLPKSALNNYQSMCGKKCFEEVYKQITVKHKGSKHKMNPKASSWTATIKFFYPEKNTFECNAFTKSAANNKASWKALHWLYINKKIDTEGRPIHSEDAVEELRKNLNPPLSFSVSSSNIDEMKVLINKYINNIEPLLKSSNKKSNLAAESISETDIDEEDIEDFENHHFLDSRTGREFRDPIFGTASKDKDPELLKNRSAHLLRNLQNAPAESELPISNYRYDILKTIDARNATVIQGAPGCGKSTRVPSYILDKWITDGAGSHCNIIVSEPRRVAALSLSSRVAYERGEELGDVCGYQVRLSTRLPKPPGGSILYCTAGALLRRLAATPDLPGCTHLILDEAHERSADSDITLALAKRAMMLNPDLKVIVMSATIDTGLFSRYFDNCPILEIPGFTHPVKSYYLDDLPSNATMGLPKTWRASSSDETKPFVDPFEVSHLIKWIHRTKPEGAMLVFLPGWNEIKRVKDVLDKDYNDTIMVLPVHSRLSNADQQKIFSSPPPGIRKVILATNIAETSITINDVSYVIDTGVHKEQKLLSDKGISSLNSDWVSKANIKQRKGRAGRVKPGECFHMYTKEKMRTFDNNPIPEILRIPLEKTVLDCKIYGKDERIINFLQQFPQPPSVQAIKTAIDDLIDLGALDRYENLTTLGKRIISFTTHPKLSKAMIHSTFFKVATPTIDLATFLSNNIDLFTCSVDNKEEVRQIKRKYHPTSDHLAMFWVCQHYRDHILENTYKSADTFCGERFLRKERINAFQNLREINIGHLQQTKLLPVRGYNKSQKFKDHDSYSNVDELVKGVLYSGLNTLIYIKNGIQKIGKLTKTKTLRTEHGQRAFISSDSVNHNVEKRENNAVLLYCGAIHSQERRGVLIRDSSILAPLTLFLFSPSVKIVYQDNEKVIFEIDEKQIKLQTLPEQTSSLMKFRNIIWTLVDHYIENEGSHGQNEESYFMNGNENCDNSELEVINKYRNRVLEVLAEILASSETNSDTTVENVIENN